MLTLYSNLSFLAQLRACILQKTNINMELAILKPHLQNHDLLNIHLLRSLVGWHLLQENQDQLRIRV